MEQALYFCFVHFKPFKNSIVVLWVGLLGFRGFVLVCFVRGGFLFVCLEIFLFGFF